MTSATSPIASAARDANGFDVGLRGGRGVLPLRQAEPTREFLRHRDRVFGRQHKLVSGEHRLVHGTHDRCRRVTAEHRHVGDVEIGVTEPIDVRETRAGRLCDPHWLVVIAAAHPRHRHAVRHRGQGTPTQRRGMRARLVESLILAILQVTYAIGIRLSRHGPRLRRTDDNGNRARLTPGPLS